MKCWSYVCDKCKKPIKGKRYRLWLYDPEDIEEEQDAKYDFDLCEACAKKVMKYLCTPTKEETSAKAPALAPAQIPASVSGPAPVIASAPAPAGPDPEVKEKRKPGPEKKIDTGKALALWKAGWDYAKIADEMGLSEKQVKSAVYRARKEEEGA